jgi:hypothetical protein
MTGLAVDSLEGFFHKICATVGNNIVFLPFTSLTDISVKKSKNDRNIGHLNW